MTASTDPPAPGFADPELDPGRDLMLAFQAGDDRAFDRLIEAHAGQVYSLLTRFLGPVADREDLVQEVFLRLLRARDRYQPTARFATFLYRVTFNLAANLRERERLRRGPRFGDGAEEDGEPGSLPEPRDPHAPDPSEELERGDLVRAVRAAIAALPERQRMALILAKYEGLPYVEIAAVLELTEQGVKSLIHRARESLRASLAASLLEESA